VSAGPTTTIDLVGAAPAAAPTPWRSRAWAITGTLSITETVSWGILYYAFSALLVPMRDAGFTTAQLTGAFSMAMLISGVAGIVVGRHLDRRSPRALMTAGSIAAALLVVTWSQVHSVGALFLVWAGIGMVMAAVLYEPAFVVLAKWFPDPAGRRQAMTAMTLVAALASFVFLPLTEALVDAHGWRNALLVLAAILAVVTIPAHALVLRKAPDGPTRPAASSERSHDAAVVLRSSSFWLLSAAFFLATFCGIAVTVHAIAYLIDQGHGPSFAAWAAGLIGISQIPGRLLFVPLNGRLSQAASIALVFMLIAVGVGLLATVHDDVGVLVALVVLGMGNGMSTLARATVLADRYGPKAYGSIAGVAAFATTGARAAAPVAAAGLIAIGGYSATLWVLAALAAVASALGYRATTRTSRGWPAGRGTTG
jgi:MFS family permease